MTVAEGDELVHDAAQQLASVGRLPPGMKVEQQSMRRIKGLERPLVIWSTRAEIPVLETTAEWIYTILTRTTGLVIVALSAKTRPDVRSIVGRLDQKRLLFWTEEAQAEFRRWTALCGTAVDPLR